MIGLGSDKNSKFWTASSSKLQSLLSCPLSKQEKEKTAFEVLKSFFVTNKVAKLGVIRMKSLKALDLIDYIIISRLPRRCTTSSSFFLQARSTACLLFLLPTRLSWNRERECFSYSWMPDSAWVLFKRHGWLRAHQWFFAKRQLILVFLVKISLFDTFYHQIRIVCGWKRRLNWAISWNPTFMQLLWLTQPSGRAEY